MGPLTGAVNTTEASTTTECDDARSSRICVGDDRGRGYRPDVRKLDRASVHDLAHGRTGLRLLPGPNLHLNPDLILVRTPPLLYSAARVEPVSDSGKSAPYREPVCVLVLLTAFAVGGAVTLVVPRLPLAAAMVLGGRSADPVAALSVRIVPACLPDEHANRG